MRNTHRNVRQRGAALVIGLILLAIITLLAVVGMNLSNSELQAATSEQLRLRAFQAAETGIEYGMISMFDVPAKPGATMSTGVKGVTGSAVDADSKAFDTYQTTIAYRGEGVPEGYGSQFTGFHYSVTVEGSSARGAKARHEQGAYVVNATGNQQSYSALP